MCDLDVYVVSCLTFHLLCSAFCEPLSGDLGFLFYDFQTWEEVLKGSERFWNRPGNPFLDFEDWGSCFGFGSRDQAGC